MDFTIWVRNNPLKFVDPTGHKEEGECSFNDEGCEGQPPTIEEFIIQTLQAMVDAIDDPARTEPILIPLDDGTTLVIMPVGSNPIQKREGYEWAQDASYVIGILGVLTDVGEVLSLGTSGPAGPSDVLGGVDILAAIAGNASSGDMWLPGKDAKPHPSLPSMFLFGQDVLWTAGVDYIAPWALGAGAGFASAQPEVGVTVKWYADIVSSLGSLWYDAGRVEGDIPTAINAGVSYQWGEWHSYVLVYP